MSGVVVVAPAGATVRGEAVEAKVQALSAGPPGRSAYKVAVDNGFEGTESDWLATLPGDPGKSAFELAVEAGFEGTEAEWRTSLEGAPGASAYDLAVEAGFEGTEAEWRASLQGAIGPLPTPVPKLITAREYTLVAGDLWKTLIFNSDYSVTVWVPEDLPDFTCTIVRNGAGTVSVRPDLGSAVVVNAPGDKLALGTRYESAVLRTVDVDSYVLKGADITAPAYNYPITGLALTSDTLIGGSPAGTYVGQLLPADIDSGETFTFQVLAGDSHFATDGDKVLAGATPTALTGSIDVWFRVTDSDHHTFDQMFTITLQPFYGADPTATVLDFVLWRFWHGPTQTEVTAGQFLAITRATNGWARDSQGVESLFGPNTFRHNDRGLLIEGQTINLVNNPDTPVTQTITGLTAGAFVVSMRGTGSIAVTGGSSGNGTANEATNLKVSLTGAGSLTLTLSGQVTFMQVEKLPNTARPAVASSAVHGVGANATRNTDVIEVQTLLKAVWFSVPNTLVYEWNHRDILWGDNCRLHRGGGGTQITTAVITPSGALNASNTLSSGPTVVSYNLTTNSVYPLGRLARAFIRQASGNNGIALWSDTGLSDPRYPAAGVESNGTPNFSQITKLVLGSRDDTNGDPFKGYLRKITIYPRALADAEMGTADTTDLPPPPFVTYPAIEPTGGEGGTTYTATTLGYMQARTLLANKRKVIIDPSLTGVEPYIGTVNVKNGDMTLQGHPLYYGFQGGGFIIGDDTHMPTNIIIRDFQIGAGNGDVGRNFDDRDCGSCWSGDTLLIDGCTFWGAGDECWSLYKGLAAARGIRNIRIRRSIIGPGLAAPVDGNGAYRKAEVPHNMGLLVADGIENVVIEECLFAGNQQRNPVFGVVFGGFCYNCLVYDWMEYGLLAFEQVSQFEKRGATAAYVNNLLKPGPNTSAAALAAAQGVLRIGDGSAYWFNGQAITDGVNFANDRLLNGDTDVAPLKGADRRSLATSMPFGSPYTPLPTATAADRQALFNRILDNVGVRARDGSGNTIPGDAAASPITRLIIQAVRNGTSLKINDEKDLTATNGGYPLA